MCFLTTMTTAVEYLKDRFPKEQFVSMWVNVFIMLHYLQARSVGYIEKVLHMVVCLLFRKNSLHEEK